MILVGALGCTRWKDLLAAPAHQQGQGWTLTVQRMTDAPDDYIMGPLHQHPGRSNRFVWALVQLRNDQEHPRFYDFDHCHLDASDQSVSPVVIDAAKDTNIPVASEAEVRAGETITRRLIFPLPQEIAPTRLRCAPLAAVPIAVGR